MYFRQIENADEVNLFQNHLEIKGLKLLILLLDIEFYNPHKDDESFKNKIKEIRRDVDQRVAELDNLIKVLNLL